MRYAGETPAVPGSSNSTCLLFVFGPPNSKLESQNARMPQPRELPIYELENSVVASLRTQGRLIVQAPTGSGKSTQIPQMLWQHGLLGDRGEVVVLQPRRLAARMLAKRVAEEAGTRLGEDRKSVV